MRAAENAAITAEITAVFGEHRGFHGSLRIHQELRAAGRHVGRHRVARLMRRARLRAKPAGHSGPAPRPAEVPLEWWRTCCSRSSSPRQQTAAGPVTSRTSEPAPPGAVWRCRTERCSERTGSICSATALSAGNWMRAWTLAW
ncbi:MAG: IS3 family transposase [Prochlorococcaceae cyanobacterium]